MFPCVLQLVSSWNPIFYLSLLHWLLQTKAKQLWDKWQTDAPNTSPDSAKLERNGKRKTKKEAAVRGCDVPLWVQELSGSDDGLNQGFGPYGLLRRRLGAGVRLPALLVPHGFNVAAAPHATARDLVILPVAGVTPPIILRHLRWHRKDSGWWAPSPAAGPVPETDPQQKPGQLLPLTWGITLVAVLQILPCGAATFNNCLITC